MVNFVLKYLGFNAIKRYLYLIGQDHFFIKIIRFNRLKRGFDFVETFDRYRIVHRERETTFQSIYRYLGMIGNLRINDDFFVFRDKESKRVLFINLRMSHCKTTGVDSNLRVAEVIHDVSIIHNSLDVIICYGSTFFSVRSHQIF